MEQKQDILESFDLIVLEKFAELPESKTKIKGRCDRYNNVDDVWTFTIERAEIKDESAMHPIKETSQLMKIVSNTCSQNPIENRQAESLTKKKQGKGKARLGKD